MSIRLTPEQIKEIRETYWEEHNFDHLVNAVDRIRCPKCYELTNY